MAIPSLGLQRYLSALRYVDAVIGNSSSGIIEVPSFGIPTLDIGDRQKGRIAAESVWHCGNSREDIKDGLRVILSKDFRLKAKGCSNPYEKMNTVETVWKVIKQYPLDNLVNKKFFDLK